MNFAAFKISEKSIKNYDSEYVLVLKEKYEVYGDIIELYEVNDIYRTVRTNDAFSSKRVYIAFKNGIKLGDTRDFYDLSHCVRQLTNAMYKSVENYNSKYFA